MKVAELFTFDEPVLPAVNVKVGVTVLTVCVAETDVLAVLKLLSLAMVALIEFEPACRAVVVQVAVNVAGGPATLTGETEVQPVIAVVVPLNVLLKVTLPVGVMPVFGVIWTVKAAESFTFDEPVLPAVNVKVGVTVLTVSDRLFELAVMKLVSLAILAPMV